MKILALDTSSQAASAALLEDGKLLGESFINIPTTHSQTILPMAQQLLTAVGIPLAEIDRFAVTCGPGSFTGLRIGLSAIKGMAFALNKPCCGVSTLESLAWNLAGWSGLVCPVMDARCKQVYTALFDCSDGTPRRLWEDQALSIEEWQTKLPPGKSVILVGDGARLCYNSFEKIPDGLTTAPAHLLYQRAASVALCAQEGELVSPGQLVPAYLRLPQAQRELLARQNPQSQQKG